MKVHEKSKDMDEKSTGNSGKIKDIEDVTIEISVRMKEGAEKKQKAHSFRKGSKVMATKAKSKELVLQFFWYF